MMLIIDDPTVVQERLVGLGFMRRYDGLNIFLALHRTQQLQVRQLDFRIRAIIWVLVPTKYSPWTIKFGIWAIFWVRWSLSRAGEA